VTDAAARGAIVKCCWAGLVAVCLAWPLGAQQVFHAGIDLVSFGVTVTDRKGNFVTDLRPEDFVVVEDGRKQHLDYFVRGVRGDRSSAEDGDGGGSKSALEVPLHMGLVFDTSGSMELDLQMSRSAAVRFLNRLPEAEDMTLVDFDTEVRVARYGQNDFARMVERIRRRKPDGWTALYDAMGVYLDGADGQDGRKIMVLYTDGGDTRSTMSFGDLVTMLKASDVTMYAIGFLKHVGSAATDMRMRLQQMAEHTGGTALFPSSLEEIDKMYDRIVEELDARYTLGYLPSDVRADGQWRNVEIKIVRSDAKNLRVRARKGYFAPYRDTGAAARR